MNNSFSNSLSFISALALVIIAVQVIPFSREKEISNHCREYYAMGKGMGKTGSTQISNKRLTEKIKIIASKMGLEGNKTVDYFCNSFYLNQ